MNLYNGETLSNEIILVITRFHFSIFLWPLFSPVVGAGDGVKLLLARRVPEHQPHWGSIVGSDHLLQEVDPDGFLVR